jgi:hypothetical protein
MLLAVLIVRQAQGINAELGLGATVDIAIESLGERAEREIVCCSAEKNLIGHCGPFLSKLCRNLTLLQKVTSTLCFQNFLSICFHYSLQLTVSPFLNAVPRATSFCNACSMQANDY